MIGWVWSRNSKARQRLCLTGPPCAARTGHGDGRQVEQGRDAAGVLPRRAARALRESAGSSCTGALGGPDRDARCALGELSGCQGAPYSTAVEGSGIAKGPHIHRANSMGIDGSGIHRSADPGRVAGAARASTVVGARGGPISDFPSSFAPRAPPYEKEKNTNPRSPAGCPAATLRSPLEVLRCPAGAPLGG